MDVLHPLNDQQFIWDGEKAIENRRKHGISFETACEVFFDYFAVYMDASVPEEDRAAVIGVNYGLRLLFVVHIVQEDEAVRIISARPANERERKSYEDG